jgi:glucokinase
LLATPQCFPPLLFPANALAKMEEHGLAKARYVTTGNGTNCEVFMAADLENSVLVYDVGGSHVAAAVCRSDAYCLGPVVSAPHASVETSDSFIDLLHSLGVKASSGENGLCGAELAIPGPFDFAAGISRMKHKLPYLYGVDLRGRLAERFGWQPNQVRFLLDSAAFLLGEIGAGEARSVERAVGITLGTGIGSAFSVDGRVVTEGQGVPAGGEIWNLPYESGIVEDYVSTRAIQRSYKLRTGALPNVARIAADAANDPDATAVFTEFGRHLGLALRVRLTEFDPDVVVVGGGISRSSHLFLPAAIKELAGLKMQLRVSTLLDNAPLAGAAVAWYTGAKQKSK